MRIISGILKGKKLFTPLNDNIRPTSDRTREAIFNVLYSRDDIEIITLLFENGADTSYKFRNKVDLYSNPFGMAVWGILYNDSVVTDDELEFIQVIIDNGITHDNKLVLREELRTYDDNPHYVKKDDNYYLLMEMIENK